MIIISQKLFATKSGSLIKVQFVDSPPVDFAVWRLELEDKGRIFKTFGELIDELKARVALTDAELEEIEKAKDSLLNTGQI